MSDAVKRAEELIDKEGAETIAELCHRDETGVVVLSKAAVFVTPITDENREQVFQAAMSMYLGERCAYCERIYTALDDLKDAVWCPHEHGRLACKSCWDEHHPEEDK